MPRLPTKDRLAQAVRVLDLLDEHEHFCELRGEHCPVAESVRERIVNAEVRDVALATALNEVDGAIRRLVGNSPVSAR